MEGYGNTVWKCLHIRLESRGSWRIFHVEQRSEIAHGQDARRHPQHHHVPPEIQVRRGRRRGTVWRTQEEEEEEAVLPATLDHLHRLDTLVLRLSTMTHA